MIQKKILKPIKKKAIFLLKRLKPKASHIKLGIKGENLATKILKDKYYTIIKRNHRNPRGEIDIIARDGDIIVFVEVKSRTFHELYQPIDNFSYKQRKRIKNSARYYMKSIGSPDFKCRFDFIEIVYSKTKKLRNINHHVDFF